eukprot:SAG31_NODE_527_length_14452_cov_4.274925_10_plen_889_part_00
MPSSLSCGEQPCGVRGSQVRRRQTSCQRPLPAALGLFSRCAAYWIAACHFGMAAGGDAEQNRAGKYLSGGMQATTATAVIFVLASAVFGSVQSICCNKNGRNMCRRLSSDGTLATATLNGLCIGATWILKLYCIGLCGLACTVTLEVFVAVLAESNAKRCGAAARVVFRSNERLLPFALRRHNTSDLTQLLPAVWIALKRGLPQHLLNADQLRYHGAALLMIILLPEDAGGVLRVWHSGADSDGGGFGLGQRAAVRLGCAVLIGAAELITWARCRCLIGPWVVQFQRSSEQVSKCWNLIVNADDGGRGSSNYLHALSMLAMSAGLLMSGAAAHAGIFGLVENSLENPGMHQHPGQGMHSVSATAISVAVLLVVFEFYLDGQWKVWSQLQLQNTSLLDCGILEPGVADFDYSDSFAQRQVQQFIGSSIGLPLVFCAMLQLAISESQQSAWQHWVALAGFGFLVDMGLMMISSAHQHEISWDHGHRSGDPRDLDDKRGTLKSSVSIHHLANMLRRVVAALVGLCKHVLRKPTSRRIAAFLLLNFATMLAELVFGLLTNSLGLISDAAHMLFDCSALAIGLWASYCATWPADRMHTYGYSRAEVLAAFTNAVCLVCIALTVLAESAERLLAPPPIIDAKSLLMVSAAGLAVNLIGLACFHEQHAAAHGHQCTGASHSHGGDGSSQNMKGIFLHILADTLGSIGVLISAVLVQPPLELYWVDPLCSLLIAVLILASVKPLLVQTTTTLLLGWADDGCQVVAAAIAEAVQDWLAELAATQSGCQMHLVIHSFHLWPIGATGSGVCSCAATLRATLVPSTGTWSAHKSHVCDNFDLTTVQVSLLRHIAGSMDRFKNDTEEESLPGAEFTSAIAESSPLGKNLERFVLELDYKVD